MALTIGYITARREPRIHWFLQSLERQLPDGLLPKLVIVDFYAMERKLTIPNTLAKKLSECIWIEPKPTVWQGRFRLTAVDFFSASNSRNTVLALAPDGHVALVDDLSVLDPQWIQPVLENMKRDDCLLCGSFQKVHKLIVNVGLVQGYEPYLAGFDTRWDGGHPTIDVGCSPAWFFGCSLAGPVEAFLKANGYPERLCDGMGYEDCVTGQAIAKHGYTFRYSQRMKTFESEEDHHNQPAMRRSDPGQSPIDKSHKLLEIAATRQSFEQDFGASFPDLRSLRNHMLGGGKFPIRDTPKVEWYTGIELGRFHEYGNTIVLNTNPICIS